METSTNQLVITKYLDQINEQILKTGDIMKDQYVFRGQANFEWKIQSSAARRLLKQNNRTQRDFLQYHSNLIESARTIADSEGSKFKDLKDLEVLAEIQHNGGATCLTDFSTNILIALWFAAEEYATDTISLYQDEKPVAILDAKILDKTNDIDSAIKFYFKYLKQIPTIELITEDAKKILKIGKEPDLTKYLIEDNRFKYPGKLFAINVSDDKIHFVNNYRENSRIDEILKKTHYRGSPYYKGMLRYWIWKPTKLNNRIIKQDSVFMFGLEQFYENLTKSEFEIQAKDKKNIRRELKSFFRIFTETVYFDMPGFSNKANNTETKISTDILSELNCYERAKELINKEEYYNVIEYLNRAIECNDKLLYTKQRICHKCNECLTDQNLIEKIYYERGNAFRRLYFSDKNLKDYHLKSLSDFELVCSNYRFDETSDQDKYFSNYQELMRNPLYQSYILYIKSNDFLKAEECLMSMKKVYKEETTLIDFVLLEFCYLKSRNNNIDIEKIKNHLDHLDKVMQNEEAGQILLYFFNTIFRATTEKNWTINEVIFLNEKNKLMKNKLKFHSENSNIKDIDLIWDYSDMKTFLEETKYPKYIISFTDKLIQIQEELNDLIYFEKNTFAG